MRIGIDPRELRRSATVLVGRRSAPGRGCGSIAKLRYLWMLELKSAGKREVETSSCAARATR